MNDGSSSKAMTVLAWVTTVICIFYVIGLAVYCEYRVPRFQQMFTEMDIRLPAVTQFCFMAVEYDMAFAAGSIAAIGVLLVTCLMRNKLIAFAISVTVAMVATALAAAVVVALTEPMMRIMQAIGEGR